jgi:RNA polymerase sigma-70 factor, ECF subfamily
MTSTSDLSSTCPDGVAAVITAVYRAQWGRLLSLLVARTRRLDLAEDALGEAFARAAKRWPIDGVPSNPAGWLYTAAWRAVVGKLRTEKVAGATAPLLAVGAGWVTPVDADHLDELGDERLQLILLCCHPALPSDSRSALALRLVLGTPTDEIARLFLVPVATMAARLTRAKRKIVIAGIPLVSPIRDELHIRLDEVCRTIYLAFTAGYTPGRGPDLIRVDLAAEALHLAVMLHALAPDAPQVTALLAVLTLQHARRDARIRDGHLVTLADQDRTLWHRDEVRAGLALTRTLRPGEGYADELCLQALIGAEHADAATATATNWKRIAALYKQLETRTGSPIVRLNRAVAVAEADGPQAGLAILEGLEQVLPLNHRVPAVRAELARRAGDSDLARLSYQQSIDLCANDIERVYLIDRLSTIELLSS